MKMSAAQYQSSPIRVAWLFPTLTSSFYWHPLFREFAKIFPETVIFTGSWPGFAPGCEGSFEVRTVAKPKIIEIHSASPGYTTWLVLPPISIMRHLLSFKPQVIFTSSFTLWTLLSLLLKPWGKWRVVVAYEGSSPTVDWVSSKARLFIRSIMARFADALISNTRSGGNYLTQILKVEKNRVFVKPYEVPDKTTLSKCESRTKRGSTDMRRPVFLFIGQIIPRKGLHLLLEACSMLQVKGYHDYTVFIVGDGPQQVDLENLTKARGLGDQVKWIGRVDYGRLQAYFQAADVFVFPTLEDTWGMVTLEAMLFGKPILCSKWAGSAEMVADGENGFVFDPYEPEKLAQLMRHFMDEPELISSMGEKSKQLIATHTPKTAAKFLSGIVRFVLDGNGRSYYSRRSPDEDCSLSCRPVQP